MAEVVIIDYGMGNIHSVYKSLVKVVDKNSKIKISISINDIKLEINRLKKKGISVIITDHQVREVLDISDYSYLLFSGEIIAHGTSEKILGNKEARKFYLGDTFKF